MIYLDNAATTKPCEAAVKAAEEVMLNSFGNASSLHSLGIKSEKVINSAKKTILSHFPQEGDIIFTSGATESNNTALLGLCETYKRQGNRVVTTTIEHPSIRQPMALLEKKGCKIVSLTPVRGEDFEDLLIAAVDENTVLAEFMAVNNETGFVIDTKKVYQGIKRKNPHCLVHVDAVQGFCKLPIYADCASISAHKIHGLKGVGALYFAKGIRFAPFMLGGGQQKNLRSGTEPTELIAAFEAAVNAYDTPKATAKFQQLNTHLLQQIAKIDGVIINSYNNVDNIVNFSVCGVRSEIMLHMLGEQEIYVSSGSACSKGALSGVLENLGVSRSNADSAIRVSFCVDNTIDEIDLLCKAIENGIKRVRR